MTNRNPRKAPAKPAAKPAPGKVEHGHPSVLNGGRINENGEWEGP